MKMTVIEVSRLAGVHPHTVRSLERRGLIRGERDVNGWRRYSPSVIAQIKKLYAMGEEAQ